MDELTEAIQRLRSVDELLSKAKGMIDATFYKCRESELIGKALNEARRLATKLEESANRRAGEPHA